MSEKYNCFLISTTHWDREWYFSVTRFRFRLVRLVDKLLDILDNEPDYRCYWFDGQVVPIEDYLATCPENSARLTAALRDKRILIGPWYSLADEFLINGESHIRNLRYGMRTMRSYGQENLIGYLPDTFGHTGQMPQILKNFEIGNAVLWRGYKLDDIVEQENFWKAPDGTQLRLCCLVRGYNNTCHIGPEHDSLANTLPDQKKFSVNRNLLLMHGIDHSLPMTGLSSLIKWAEENYPELSIRHSTLQEYLDNVQPTEKAVTFIGDLLHRPPLESVLSSRQNQKNLLRQAENLLIYYAEPLRVLTNRKSHPGFLETAWKNLLKNAAHDSVCGCHDDLTAYDVENRFRHAVELSEGTLREDIAAPLLSDDFNAVDLTKIRFFNPLPQAVSAQLEFEYRIPADQEVPEFPQLDDGTALQTVSVREELRQQFHNTYNPTDDPVKVLKMVSAPVDFPGMGCYDFHIVNGQAPEQRVFAAGNVLENDFVRAVLHEDGSFDLYDKEKEQLYSGLNAFRFERDNGDLYTAVIEGEALRAVLSGSWEIAAAGACRGEICGKFTFPGKAVSLHTRFILDSHSKMVDMICEVDNQEKNCRISADFPIAPDSELFAHMPFDLVKCRIAPAPRPMHFCAGAVKGANALTVANNGLYELQYNKEDAFAITLFRAAGVIMHPLRVYTATSGQLPGVTVVNYSIGITGASAAEITAAGFHYNLPPMAFQVPENAPEIGTLLAFSDASWFPGGVEDMGDAGVAIRFFNAGNGETSGRVDCSMPHRKVSRIFAGGREIETAVNCSEIRLGGHEIATLLFK